MARVTMFGALQQVAGWRERSFEVASLNQLRAELAAEDEILDARLCGPGVVAVVNHEMVRGDHPLEPGDEVAFLPPVSGG